MLMRKQTIIRGLHCDESESVRFSRYVAGLGKSKAPTKGGGDRGSRIQLPLAKMGIFRWESVEEQRRQSASRE